MKRFFIACLFGLILLYFSPYFNAYAELITGGGGGSGGGGTPGGTNGQVQFNNSGAFGGETVAIATGCAANGGTIGNSLAGTISTTQVSVAHVNNDTIANGECGQLGTFNSGSAVAITLPQAANGGNFAAGWYEDFTNYGAGVVTFTTSTSTFLTSGTPSTYTLSQNQSVRFTSSTVSAGNWDVSGVGKATSVSGANPTATAGPSAINGVATTFMRSDAAPAVQAGSAAQQGIVQVDNTSIAAAAGTISLKALAGDCTTTAGAVTLTCAGRRAVADASITLSTADVLVAYTSISAARTVTLPAASTFAAGRKFVLVDESGSVTPAITISFIPNGSDNIQGSNTTQVACATAKCFVEMETDGSANWYVVRRSMDDQLFTANGTWNRVIGIRDIGVWGCGGGGQGGGGATTASGTAASGGAGGGGADCHEKHFKVGDVPASTSVTIGAGGSAGGQGSVTTTGQGASGSNGSNGTDTSFGNTIEKFFAGGGGQSGKNSATASTGGSGGSQWSDGSVGGAATTGCLNNGGGSGAGGSGQSTCGGGGSGSGTTGTGGFTGGYSGLAAPGGQTGAGVTTAPAAQSAAAGNGGGSMGCLNPPVGGAIGTNGGAAVQPDFNYHPGCGGAGGGGALGQTNTAGAGTAGTNGGGGGGGGSICVVGGTCSTAVGNAGGQGGNGGAGFLRILAW